MNKRVVLGLLTLTLCFTVVTVLATAQRRGGKKAGSAAAAQRASVEISNFKFEPKELRVKAGTVVTWTNKEGTHTAISDNDTFSSPTLGPGKTFSHKFTKAGTYPYYCSFHGSSGGGDMAGTITVVP